MIRFLFFVLMTCVTFSSCQKKGSLNQVTSPTFLQSWNIQTKEYLDSCSGRDNNMDAYSLVLNRSNQFSIRKMLLDQLLEQKGNDFVCSRIYIVETSQVGTPDFYIADVLFDDEEEELRFSFYPNPDELNFEGLHRFNIYLEDFFVLNDEFNCCKKYEAQHMNCTYRTLFEVSPEGEFHLSKFCLEYGY